MWLEKYSGGVQPSGESKQTKGWCCCVVDDGGDGDGDDDDGDDDDGDDDDGDDDDDDDDDDDRSCFGFS